MLGEGLVQSFVYRKGLRTQPCRAFVLEVSAGVVVVLTWTVCCLLVKEIVKERDQAVGDIEVEHFSGSLGFSGWC